MSRSPVTHLHTHAHTHTHIHTHSCTHTHIHPDVGLSIIYSFTKPQCLCLFTFPICNTVFLNNSLRHKTLLGASYWFLINNLFVVINSNVLRQGKHEGVGASYIKISQGLFFFIVATKQQGTCLLLKNINICFPVFYFNNCLYSGEVPWENCLWSLRTFHLSMAPIKLPDVIHHLLVPSPERHWVAPLVTGGS